MNWLLLIILVALITIIFQLVRKDRKPSRERSCRVGLNLTIGDMAEAVAFSLDQPPAGGAEPRVEAKDDHLRVRPSSRVV